MGAAIFALCGRDVRWSARRRRKGHLRLYLQKRPIAFFLKGLLYTKIFARLRRGDVRFGHGHVDSASAPTAEGGRPAAGKSPPGGSLSDLAGQSGLVFYAYYIHEYKAYCGVSGMWVVREGTPARRRRRARAAPAAPARAGPPCRGGRGARAEVRRS